MNWPIHYRNIFKRVGMVSFKEAMYQIHFPDSTEKLRNAQTRLKFEELFYIQLNMLQTAGQRKLRIKGLVFSHVGSYFNTFYSD